MPMMLQANVLQTPKTSNNKPAYKTVKKTVSQLRPVAAEILLGVLQGQSLSRLMPQNAERVAENERPRLAEIVQGSCRFYFHCEAVLKLLLQKPLRNRDRVIEALLLTSLYQLMYMRIKEHAVVAEAVEATRLLKRPMFSKLVNGVLRRFLREREALLETANISKIHGLPQWLATHLAKDWPDHWIMIAESYLSNPAFTIRLNIRRQSMSAYLAGLQDMHIESNKVDGIDSALILDQAMPVMSLPGFADGLVSIQDAGAQMAARLLNPTSGESVLDACAAPGGKTGHLLEMAENLKVTAMDVDSDRMQRVEDNLKRLGLTAEIQVADAARQEGAWAEQMYDAILLDVPCSATGVVRRHPDIRLLRRAADIESLVMQQQAILNNCWQRVKPGGRLLYVTCSLLSVENENQIAEFLLNTVDAAEVTLDPPVRHHKRLHGIALTPEKNDMDGFYYALLQKNHVS